MKKLLLLFLSIIPLCFWAQEKIYIDGVGNPTTKEKAKFYRIISQQADRYHIKDFFLDGKLQMDAYATKKDFRSIEEFVGKFSFYFEDGKKGI